MKARILPLDDIAEYGKTDTVVLTLSINPTEAGIILDAINDGLSERNDPTPTAVLLMTGYLQTIRDADSRAYRKDVVNTDGRAIKYTSTATEREHLA